MPHPPSALGPHCLTWTVSTCNKPGVHLKKGPGPAPQKDFLGRSINREWRTRESSTSSCPMWISCLGTFRCLASGTRAWICGPQDKSLALGGLYTDTTLDIDECSVLRVGFPKATLLLSADKVNDQLLLTERSRHHSILYSSHLNMSLVCLYELNRGTQSSYFSLSISTCCVSGALNKLDP